MIEDRIQEGVQKFMAGETNRINIKERDACWAAEMAKLNAALCEKNIHLDGSPNIGSQQGSWSKGILNLMKELELEGVKKKLDLIEDNVCAEEVKEVEKKTEVEDKDVQEKNDVDEKNEVEGKNRRS